MISKINTFAVVLVLLSACTLFFKNGLEGIHQRREGALDSLENHDASGRGYFSSALESLASKVRPGTGLVKGIVYSDNASSTVISDAKNIVHENSTIDGVRIVKIHKDRVEFTKNGRSWTQKVGQPPSPEWYK
jgi:type II secretory pathway component PulC